MLIGGAGADQLYGDALEFRGFTGIRGTDRFVFAPHSGRDTVWDFQLSMDKLEISLAYGYANFAALQPHIGGNPLGNATISLNGSIDRVWLIGVQPSELQAGDFIFA